MGTKSWNLMTIRLPELHFSETEHKLVHFDRKTAGGLSISEMEA